MCIRDRRCSTVVTSCAHPALHDGREAFGLVRTTSDVRRCWIGSRGGAPRLRHVVVPVAAALPCQGRA
eukprot:1443759-Alexandrium_andersonii.AAC.1